MTCSSIVGLILALYLFGVVFAICKKYKRFRKEEVNTEDVVELLIVVSPLGFLFTINIVGVLCAYVLEFTKRKSLKIIRLLWKKS